MGEGHAMRGGWHCHADFDPTRWMKGKAEKLEAILAMAGSSRGRGRGPGHGFMGGAHGAPFWFGAQWSGGGPFGKRGFRPPWAQGPKARRGDVRLAILALLAEGPRNGYQIIQEVHERSDGAWKPSPGAVYPALQQLSDEGLVRGDESEGRRTFQLTDAGREYVTEHGDEIDGVFESMTPDVPSDVSGLFDLVGQSGAALAQIAHSGSQAQIDQAKAVLTETRRKLYHILAEDGGGNGSDDGSDDGED